jgi:hypothetical protein
MVSNANGGIVRKIDAPVIEGVDFGDDKPRVCLFKSDYRALLRVAKAADAWCHSDAAPGFNPNDELAKAVDALNAKGGKRK